MARPTSQLGEAPLAVDLIVFPAHALVVVEERLREQGAEGVDIPAGIEHDELALRILVAAELTRSRGRPAPSRG